MDIQHEDDDDQDRQENPDEYQFLLSRLVSVVARFSQLLRSFGHENGRVLYAGLDRIDHVTLLED